MVVDREVLAAYIGADEYGQHTNTKTKALATEGFHFHYGCLSVLCGAD
jgi:hypothetical protein